MSDVGAKGELLGTQTKKPVAQNAQPAEAAAEKEKQETKNNTGFGQQFFCDALNGSTVNTIVDGSTINTIVLVGFPGYGKTTFVGSLYYRLLKNLSYHNLTFFDSDTYSGLERRFAIRTLKTDIDADTKRTLKGDDHIVTLSLMNETTGERKKVVISDRSGEDYKAYTGQAEDMLEDELLKVADHVVFFIDTQEIMETFQSVKYDYGLLLTGMAEHNILPESSRLSVVFNKHDLVNKENKEKFWQKVNSVEKLFKEKFPNRIFSTYFVDLTGREDSYIAVDRLSKDLFSCSSDTLSKCNETLDWVGNKLKELRNE